MKVLEVLAHGLADHGVDTVFGLLGDGNLFMVDSFVRSRKGRYVAAAHESGAVLMAIGYAALSGRIGVATVTHGPALSNTVTALIEGVKTYTPLLLICGDTAVLDRGNLQNFPQREIVISAGAGFEQLRSASTVEEDIATAIYRAFAERRPIALNVPADLMWEEATYEKRARIVVPQVSNVPGGEALENAVGIIASAKRPLVLAGRGAIDDTSRAALVRLAERIEAPLATTLKAQDLFRGQKYNLGLFGTLSTPDTVDTIMKSDCVVAFGASLNGYTSSKGTFLKGKRVIQVNASPQDIAQHYQPTVALVGGPAETVERMLYWLAEAEVPGSGFRSELPEVGSASYEKPKWPTSADQTRLPDIDLALDRLNDCLPAERTVVFDAGRFAKTAWRRIANVSPQRSLMTHNSGSIGLGMGYAIGAALAAPDTPLVLVTGDGGFMHAGVTEFNTAVRAGIDLIVIVCNDGGYGGEHIQFRNRGMDPALSLFEWPDLAPLATALGGTGISVRSVDDLSLAAEAINKRQKPLLIDLKLDPEKIPST